MENIPPKVKDKAEDEKKSASSSSFSTAAQGWEHPFAKMKIGPKPYMSMPEQSMIEWKLVKSSDDCIKWHLKWTPWFSPQMIEALVKYGYNAPHTE